MSEAGKKAAQVLAGARKIHPDFVAFPNDEGDEVLISMTIISRVDENTDVPGAIQALREIYKEGQNRISNLLGTRWRRRNSKVWYQVTEHRGTGGMHEPTVTLHDPDAGDATTIPVDELRTYWTRKGWEY